MTPWKPRKQDGYDLCDAINGGHCTCRRNGVSPCRSLIRPLAVAHQTGRTAVEVERERMRRDTRAYLLGNQRVC